MKTTVQKLVIIFLALAIVQISYSQSNKHREKNIRKHVSTFINHQGSDFNPTKGFWSLNKDEQGDYLQLASHKHSAYNFSRNSFFISFGITTSELEAIKRSSNSSISRASGTLNFKENNSYVFEINTAFKTFLASEGISSDQPYDYLKLFIGDIDKSYVIGIKKRGFLPTMRTLSNLGLHSVGLDYIDDMMSVYPEIDLNMLKKFKIHNVTKNYIDDLAQLGYNLEPNMIKKFAIHNISTVYIRDLNNAGYRNLDANMIKKFAIHRVSIEYIEGLSALGYTDLEPKDIKNFAVHNISLDYIKSLLNLDINKPTTSAIKKAKIHNVSANFIEHAIKDGHDSKELAYYAKLKIRGIY